MRPEGEFSRPEIGPERTPSDVTSQASNDDARRDSLFAALECVLFDWRSFTAKADAPARHLEPVPAVLRVTTLKRFAFNMTHLMRKDLFIW